MPLNHFYVPTTQSVDLGPIASHENLHRKNLLMSDLIPNKSGSGLLVRSLDNWYLEVEKLCFRFLWSERSQAGYGMINQKLLHTCRARLEDLGSSNVRTIMVITISKNILPLGRHLTMSKHTFGCPKKGVRYYWCLMDKGQTY